MLRNFILLSLLSLISTGLNAQSVDLAPQAIETLKNQFEDLGLTTTDVADLRLAQDYTSSNGAQHIIVQQYYQGIPVYNGQAALHYLNGELFFQTSSLVSGFAEQLPSTTPGISAVTAIMAAAELLDLNPTTSPRRIGGSDQVVVFNWDEVADSPITATLDYHLGEMGQIVLAWRIDLDEVAVADYWQLHLDAEAGRLLDRFNYTVYCDFDHGQAGSKTEECHEHYQLVPPAVYQLQHSQESLADGAKYMVYPLGLESPLDGEQVLVVDPADPIASPKGWHSTESLNGSSGTRFTYTRGNNVYAYDDSEDDNSPNVDEAVDGGDSLVFNFPWSLTTNPEEQKESAITQLFYMNNIMHDFTYHHGFDEEGGNFQHNTYGNGGEGSDAVRAEAQDGSGINNANFGTPPDGSAPRMQMFLWTGGAENLLNIEYPEIVEGPYTAIPAAFGPEITTDTLRGNVIVAFDDSADPLLCCEPIINHEEVKGNFALIRRGDCFFETKVNHAEVAQAIGVIICDPTGFGGGALGNSTEPDPGIPSLMIPESECVRIRAALAAGDSVVANFVAPGETVARDSDVDNGIIAHEYGHGISNRGVGGPGNTSCLFNGEQMGEGWSDFFALVTSPQLSLEGADRRPIGAYANGGSGIRRQPYSTDMGVNTYTYDDIIVSGILNTANEPVVSQHNLGEIWAAVLWDLYWTMVDEYGFDEDLTTGSGGNNLAVELVIEGMKYTACLPGMVDGRNGILAADFALHDGANQCLIWDVFARRGLGYLAEQGTTNSILDGREHFEVLPSCIPTVKLTKTSDVDNIQAGEEITYLLEVVNHKEEEVTGVTIVDELPTGLTLIESSVVGAESFTVSGNTVTFVLDDMAFEDEILVRYRVSTDELIGSTSHFLDDVENGDELWDVIPLNDGNFFWEVTTNNVYAGEQAFFVENSDQDNDQTIQPTDPIAIQGSRPALRFYTDYATEGGWDGGVVEVSNTGGASWERIGQDQFLRNGYRGEIQEPTFDEAGVFAFWGDSDGYNDAIVDLGDYAGEDLMIRWRFRSDANTGAEGWWIDNIEQLDLFAYDGEACLSTAEGDNACARVADAGVVVGAVVSTATIDPVLGETDIRVFPNPADDYFRVSVRAQKAGPLSLTLIGVDGRTVINQSLDLLPGEQQVRFETQALPAGIYLLQALGAQQLETIKITIQ